MFTDNGVTQIRDYMATQANSAPTYLAVGTAITAETKADTTLGTETGRYALDSVTTGTGTVTYIYSVTTAQQNGNSLTEVGIFNAASSGTMTSRTVHNALAKTSSDTLQYQITYRFEN